MSETSAQIPVHVPSLIQDDENDDAKATILHFRPLQESDHDQIKSLHEELFPVKYSTEFYDSVVRNRTINGAPLLSRVAIAKGFDDAESCINTGTCKSAADSQLHVSQNENGQPISLFEELAKYVDIPDFQENDVSNILTISHHNSNNDHDHEKKADHLIACIVGCFLDCTSRSSSKDDLPRSLIRDPMQHSYLFYIMTLGATEEYRKQRLGTKLVEDCMKMVEQVESCGGVYLHVITYNTAAINFYERLGFYRIEEIKGMFVCTLDLLFTVINLAGCFSSQKVPFPFCSFVYSRLLYNRWS